MHSSPNVGERRAGFAPTMLILHYTGMPSAAKAIDWLARPESKVSCHYVIDVTGRITQMVPERMRAWHAGVAHWAGESDINSASVGIEIQNPGHEDGYHAFPRAQMRAVRDLALDITMRNDIAPERVLAHSDVAPLRKIDPGEKFDWRWMAHAGVGHWVPAVPRRAHERACDDPGMSEAMRSMLVAYGYGVGVDGASGQDLATVVRAFQRHFRPTCVDGIVDRSTLATLERLLDALAKGAILH
ncbi:MAG: N-acetylmuramoyl-L-alanine amidase [Hyphomicrobiaceae bacterium]